jgi:hypothetical protein
MSFPNPAWLKTLDAAERRPALARFKADLARLYAIPHGRNEDAADGLLAKAEKMIASTKLTNGIPLPTWLRKNDAVGRTSFLFRAAALYGTEKGTLRALSLALGMHSHSVSAIARRKIISAETACKLESLCGKTVLPRSLLNPSVFGLGDN